MKQNNFPGNIAEAVLGQKVTCLHFYPIFSAFVTINC